MSPVVLESIKKLINNVLNRQENLKVFNLSFFGGEPFE